MDADDKRLLVAGHRTMRVVAKDVSLAKEIYCEAVGYGNKFKVSL